MKIYLVYFQDSQDRYITNTKVKADDFVSAVAKVVAKYPGREIRELSIDRESEDEIID